MKILSIECSAVSASAAIVEDGRILAHAFVNVKLTHSQTLMPMIKNVLDTAFIDISQIEGIAVAVGPGSFTGIRIGIAAAKGLAAPRSLPCAAVSTLRAMAQQFLSQKAIICAVMDARCNQVYNALFEVDGDKITRLCEDRALGCDELAKELLEYSDRNEKIIITGDGTDIFMPFVSGLTGVTASYEILRHQNAAAVGLAAEESFRCGDTVSADRLLPVYLRLPQAERELKAKIK